MSHETATVIPRTPYRGIRPFRFTDEAIFFGRRDETDTLADLVGAFRGVLLYGDSGSGKSSLVEAGLLPQLYRRGFAPVRVRTQPRTGEELVVESIATSDDAADAPVVLGLHPDGPQRTVMSIAEFDDRVRMASEHRPLLVFDQFEELLTLFDSAKASRQAIAEMIAGLLHESLPVKLVLTFREDYLGRVKQLLRAHPELVDQALQLGPLSADTLPMIIQGPFERFPGGFEREFHPAFASRLASVLGERFGDGDMSLTEVQTVCLRLWQSPDPDDLLTRKGLQGLLEDEIGEAVASFPPDLRVAAIALLSELVTPAGTRNVVAAEDLSMRIRESHPDFAPGSSMRRSSGSSMTPDSCGANVAGTSISTSSPVSSSSRGSAYGGRSCG